MSLRKFSENDVFYNVLKTKPHAKFSIYNGTVTYKSDFANTVPSGFAGVNDLNFGTDQSLEEECSYSLDFSEVCNSQYIPLV